MLHGIRDKSCKLGKKYWRLWCGILMLLIASCLTSYLCLLLYGKETCQTSVQELAGSITNSTNPEPLDNLVLDPLPSFVLPITIYLTPGWNISAANDRNDRLGEVLKKVKEAFHHPSLISKIVIKEEYRYLSSLTLLEPTPEGLISFNSFLSHTTRVNIVLPRIFCR